MVKTSTETLNAEEVAVEYKKLQSLINEASIVYQATTYTYKVLNMEMFIRTTLTKSILIEREEIDKVLKYFFSLFSYLLRCSSY